MKTLGRTASRRVAPLLALVVVATVLVARETIGSDHQDTPEVELSPPRARATRGSSSG
jgi:hypothetical protein